MKQISGKKQTAACLIAAAVLCCGIMAVVDGVLMPGYAVKSICKIVLFMLAPLGLSFLCRDVQFREIFRFQKSGILLPLLLGGGVFGVILAAYAIFRNVFDFSGIAASLSQNAGVSRENFMFVALYISFANSLLEEFFFRGFLFVNLKESLSRRWAYLISAFAFAMYHVAMMIGWFSFLPFFLCMIGLAAGGMIFAYMNEKQGSVYASWLVHMCANFAINTIGFLLMK
ncbi:MAG: CPBP family intramembrane metalloprotease [Oscillospiraceae bacterium]|nr:CPBP family intramembrane metalloprotease [Oscillospiraceae bacterium]